MKLTEAQFLLNIIENAGEEVKLEEDYSGRGMFGQTTVGLSIKLHPVALIPIIFSWVSENSGENKWTGGNVPDFPSLRIDNMGQGFIIY